MSHIHLTGRAKVQQLNCAKGKATTFSAIHDINLSTDILLLFLQEPWLSDNGEPPLPKQDVLFTPSLKISKNAMYLHKDLNLQQRLISLYTTCAMAISIILSGKSTEIINLYTPTKKETEQFLQDHRPLHPAPVTGDFNAHHKAWDGDLAERAL